jgi:ubiquinone/menaquinone biosynthesis C-methylase UbiE
VSTDRRPPPGFPEILSATKGIASALDVGCGSGRLAVELAARGASVTGIDVSSCRLTAARERAERAGVDARFLLADMTDPLPFADGEFAAAVSRLSLMIASDPVPVLRELARVIVPGGPVVTAVWARVEENPWFGVPRAAVAAALGPQQAAFARVFGRLGDLDELVGLHRSAGLEATGTVIRDELRPGSAADHWRDLVGGIGHFRRLAETFSPAEEHEVVAELDRRLDAHRSSGGLRLARSLVLVTAAAARRGPSPCGPAGAHPFVIPTRPTIPRV